jgi:hypothetical protein
MHLAVCVFLPIADMTHDRRVRGDKTAIQPKWSQRNEGTKKRKKEQRHVTETKNANAALPYQFYQIQPKYALNNNLKYKSNNNINRIQSNRINVFLPWP